MKTRYEIIEITGRTTTRFWILDLEQDKVVTVWNTLSIAQLEVEHLTKPLLFKPACACVSRDAISCASKRDHHELDDPSYEPRRCDCACHSEDSENDED